MEFRRLCFVVWTVVAAGCMSVGQETNRKGVEYYNQGNIMTAKEFFLEALKHEPNAPNILYNAASCYHKLKQYKQADLHYRRCLTCDPMFAKAYHGLAGLLVEQDQEDKAFALLEEWVRQYPILAAARVELAWLHRSAGDLHRAHQLLDEAVELEPENTVALTDLADINYALGLKSSARTLYEKSLALNPDQPDVRARLGSLERAVAVTTTQPSAEAQRIASERKGAKTH